mmetsp:Transcript_57460/g.108113  ORF Transcript_57460/g.108113 Transcript_57460/m.108113 type:complete len:220 (+) Transcript_57460:265-924(+)
MKGALLCNSKLMPDNAQAIGYFLMLHNCMQDMQILQSTVRTQYEPVTQTGKLVSNPNTTAKCLLYVLEIFRDTCHVSPKPKHHRFEAAAERSRRKHLPRPQLRIKSCQLTVDSFLQSVNSSGCVVLPEPGPRNVLLLLWTSLFKAGGQLARTRCQCPLQRHDCICHCIAAPGHVALRSRQLGMPCTTFQRRQFRKLSLVRYNLLGTFVLHQLGDVIDRL